MFLILVPLVMFGQDPTAPPSTWGEIFSNPAKWLGLNTKGHLSPGADADITVVSLAAQKPVMSVVDGKILMYEGVIFPAETTIITTEYGEKAVKELGFKTKTIDLKNTAYFLGM